MCSCKHREGKCSSHHILLQGSDKPKATMSSKNPSAMQFHKQNSQESSEVAEAYQVTKILSNEFESRHYAILNF